MGKYQPLGDYLRRQDKELVAMRFEEIERIVGSKLPEKSTLHRAWWSNNSSNNVMTRVWPTPATGPSRWICRTPAGVSPCSPKQAQRNCVAGDRSGTGTRPTRADPAASPVRRAQRPLACDARDRSHQARRSDLGREVMQPLLLDTCAVIWIAENEKLAPDAVEALDSANDTGAATYISPITAWEIGMLVSRDRLKLLITPQRWFARLFDAQGVRTRKHVARPLDRRVIPAGQSAARSRRPHHRRHRPRLRLYADYARPFVARLWGAGACARVGMLTERRLLNELIPIIGASTRLRMGFATLNPILCAS